jgi:large subunit ribosomal protein L2
MDKLKLGFKSAYGRSRGRISSYHREKGHKKGYRILNFAKALNNVQGKILFIKQDGYRSSFIAGVYYTNGYFVYMLAIHNMKVGDYIITKTSTTLEDNQIQKGLSCQLNYVKIGEKIHNIEYFPGTSGKVARSAGTFVKVVKKYNETALIKLASGEFRLFFLSCLCTIGRVSNINHNEVNIGNAGKNRILGKRPVVRGRAMNPVDHPHGGRTNGGIVPRTPWGALTRGVQTVTTRKAIIIKKRKK